MNSTKHVSSVNTSWATQRISSALPALLPATASHFGCSVTPSFPEQTPVAGGRGLCTKPCQYTPISLHCGQAATPVLPTGTMRSSTCTAQGCVPVLPRPSLRKGHGDGGRRLPAFPEALLPPAITPGAGLSWATGKENHRIIE